MRRLARLLFTLCSAVSLLLCVAVALLWQRSHAHADEVTWAEEEGDVPAPFYVARVTSASGVLDARLTRHAAGDVMRWPVPTGLHHESRPARRPGLTVLRRRRFGAGIDRAGDFAAAHVWFPHWAGVLVSAAPPAAWVAAVGLRGRRARRRHNARPCPGCGYDLRASPGRCPECGAGAVD